MPNPDELLDPVAKFLVWLESEGYKIAKLAYWTKMPGVEPVTSEDILARYNDRFHTEPYEDDGEQD